MALSDRQLDAFDNPAKMACREGNLRVLSEAASLLWHDGDRTRLRCDWCELSIGFSNRAFPGIRRSSVTWTYVKQNKERRSSRPGGSRGRANDLRRHPAVQRSSRRQTRGH